MNGDFEVLPRGTIAELRELRAFARNLSDLDKSLGISTPQAIRTEIAKINQFYSIHIEKYPANG